MTIGGNGEWFPLPNDESPGASPNCDPPERLDSLMPADAVSGATSHQAFRVCLGAFIDLVARHGQPLTLLAIAPDPSDALRFLGEKGARLIGNAIARWLRQETRIHDVIGRSAAAGPNDAFVYLMICPLMTETAAAKFADRLREAMTTSAADEGTPWLTLSVGVASLSLDTHSPDALILRSEEALSSAQRRGGGRVWSHSDSVRRIVERDQPESRHD